MEKEEDCICCREFEIMDPIREAYNVTCITDHPGYERNCLNEHVVETSFYEFLDYHGHVGDEKPIHE